jgi:heme-degrading monooxygenase HmoA
VYGTIARMKIERENLDGLRAFGDQQRQRTMPGYRGSWVLVPDEWTGEVVLVVMFDDEESYRKNAHDPATEEAYPRLRALLEADPEWTDGEWFEA